MRFTLYNTLQDKETGIPYLVKEWSKNGLDGTSFPKEIYEATKKFLNLDQRTEEHVYMFCIDVRCKLIGVLEVSHGTIASSFLNPREIIMKALLCNAINIILVHNHPSGNPNPSKEDRDSKNRLKEACNIVGLTLLDFIIVGEYYYSFNERGIL